MIKSMTGYGRGENKENNKNIVAEIKSLNHRYVDFSVNVSRQYSFLEDLTREYLQKYIARGKIDVYISIESYGEDEAVISINDSLAENYINALRYLKDKFNLQDDISVSSVAKYNDIFIIEKKQEDQEQLWEIVEKALNMAVEDLIVARSREGERLRNDLVKRSQHIGNIVVEIKSRAPQIVEEYRKKIEQRVSEYLSNVAIDENRLLTEVCLFADRVSIDEEIVRLQSHLVEFANTLNCEQPVGRRLDFLIQEMNREVNTIGSKANDIYVAQRVVEIKSEIEKLREQIQNIE